MKIVGMIPARMGSSRFPGKPLAQILGLPMIQHVYSRVAMCAALDEVYIATCDAEIHESVAKFGGKSIDTSTTHQRASDRCAEAAEGIDAEIIVMVQGDEPMTVPDMIDQSIAPMIDNPSIGCVNLAKPITTVEEYQDPNTIKIVMDLEDNALYFSRQSIPTCTSSGPSQSPVHKQVCIIPFRRKMLLKYSKLEPTPLEVAESVDMMRFLEHGYKVRMVRTEHISHAVDTEADRVMVESIMKKDPLLKTYM